MRTSCNFGYTNSQRKQPDCHCFLVDLSNSNEEHLEEAEKYLQETISKMPSGNVYGIVTFGKIHW